MEISEKRKKRGAYLRDESLGPFEEHFHHQLRIEKRIRERNEDKGEKEREEREKRDGEGRRGERERRKEENF